MTLPTSLETPRTPRRQPRGRDRGRTQPTSPSPGPRWAGCASGPGTSSRTGDKVAGDAFSAETLGRTLSRRVAELADDPSTPLFFGRLTFGDAAEPNQTAMATHLTTVDTTTTSGGGM